METKNYFTFCWLKKNCLNTPLSGNLVIYNLEVRQKL